MISIFTAGGVPGRGVLCRTGWGGLDPVEAVAPVEGPLPYVQLQAMPPHPRSVAGENFVWGAVPPDVRLLVFAFRAGGTPRAVPGTYPGTSLGNGWRSFVAVVGDGDVDKRMVVTAYNGTGAVVGTRTLQPPNR
ncbi:hypothetical protein [Nakamurella endophytica]|uniref:Uncharacterized protein n=1 Tax=Nakamurella endophytica TaxID=1748367 RepID=A0A917TBB6_9ACTN|nr:hypothetical protein [Nakamurella endophytica]GGM17296.1 hypothetical protein GCM10011594_41680 [Nakamurella endophytica]